MVGTTMIALTSLLSLAVPPSGTGGRPAGMAVETDCAVRSLALEFAAKLSPTTQAEVFDALQLGVFCNATRPPQRPTVSVTGAHTPSETDVIVDPVAGDDEFGAGTGDSPFRSIGRALISTRKRLTDQPHVRGSGCTQTITLKGGVHYLNKTMELTATDSGLCVVGAAGEEAILSGGLPLTDMTSWTKVKGAYKISLPANIPYFDQLFVDGRREIRARYPNGDPETTGLHTSPTGYVMGSNYKSESPKPSSGQITVNLVGPGSTRIAPDFPKFKMTFGGLCERYAKNRSFWGGTPRPTSLVCSDSDIGCKNFTWDPQQCTSKVNPAVMHMFHGSHWGGWMFNVSSFDSTTQTIGLDPWGGQQEARGNSKGAEWRVDNVLAELDANREWFADFETSPPVLWYIPPNGTAPPSNVVVPHLRTLMKIAGDEKTVATDISLNGFTVTHSLTSYQQPYEVPSGGDWAMHRGGAIFVESTENIMIENVHFTRLGGNAVLLSNHVHNTTFTASEFSWIGDNAISQMGSVKFDRSHNMSAESNDLMDGTDGMHPIGTMVRGCVFREIGVYGKQVSAFASALSEQTTILSSIFFNGPRAGINWNDGFGGGNLIEGNLLFNWVRETSDHGNFNSWDRIPFITTATSRPSTDVLRSYIHQNFVLSNYRSTWPLDHDDGSCYYTDTYNYLIYAGAKNFLGMEKVSANNVYVGADLNGFDVCAVDDSAWLKNGTDHAWHADIFANNTCILSNVSSAGPGALYHFSRCDPGDLANTVDKTYGNKFLYSGGEASGANPVAVSCGKKTLSLSDFQSCGFDVGSKVNGLPDTKATVQLGRTLLGI